MELKTPFVLMLIPLGIIVWFVLRPRFKIKAFNFSSLDIAKSALSSWRVKCAFIPGVLRVLAVLLFIVALSGPRLVSQKVNSTVEGIDIVLALDVSGSMAAEDFQIEGQRKSRIEIIKKIVGEFVDARDHDRIALVAFGSRAYTVCPLTRDHGWLKMNLERLHLGVIEDGTAIGSGVSTSVLRLKDSKAKSRIIVLLTDGMNNAGRILPMAAAKIAREKGIKIYTVGAGTKGYAPFPVTDVFGRTFYQNIHIDLNEDELTAMANLANGKYFRATDTESLRNIYKEIDRLEKSKIEEQGYKEYKEMFVYFLIAALVIVGLEVILSNTWLLRIP